MTIQNFLVRISIASLVVVGIIGFSFAKNLKPNSIDRSLDQPAPLEQPITLQMIAPWDFVESKSIATDIHMESRVYPWD